MSGFSDRPPPSSSEAIDKVFELAREYLGCLGPDERADWEEWLDAVRPRVVLSRAGAASAEIPVVVSRACAVCGGYGHNRKTCPKRESP